MAFETELLFIDDAFLTDGNAEVVAVNGRGGVILDRTIFYATSGGQPGDTGTITRADGTKIGIAATVCGESKSEIVHVPENGSVLPDVGEKITMQIDWERRHKLMRMHTACHLLTVACPYPITGAAVGEAESRIDFDIPDFSLTKADITQKLMELVSAEHPVFTQWIEESELDANPDLVKSKNVRPPRGTGRVRLVCIGAQSSVDSQPCGGTHVSNTAEVGEVHIGKIEKKGRENRRFRIRFGPLPE